jgi:hypothetical protein
MERRPRRLAFMAAAGAAAAYAWWTSGLRPFTWPALGAVGVAGVGTILLGTRRRRPFEPRAHDAIGVLIWTIVCALLVGWEVAAYLQHPRADHPTLSALADRVIDWRPARALAFLAWMALGVDLSRR